MVSMVLNVVIMNEWPRKCDWLVEKEACRVRFRIWKLKLVWTPIWCKLISLCIVGLNYVLVDLCELEKGIENLGTFNYEFDGRIGA